MTHVGTNRTRAMDLFWEASGRRDTEATYYLGRAYATGAGVPANVSRAAEMYRLAIKSAPSFRCAAAPNIVSPALSL